MYLVGFIEKKFITTHRDMNVKFCLIMGLLHACLTPALLMMGTETARNMQSSYKNKFEILVHLVGFTEKKSGRICGRFTATTTDTELPSRS